ncbi:MAG: GGDEF domain-containing protein [Alphaproteobacteria bacterium]|nr:GGDEF domain-containing protein [Alphaproteobacteria bacterium]
MHAAAFSVIVTTVVAALFAVSFAVLALTYASQRRALWFSASYLIGMLSPLSEFLLPLSAWPWLFMATSYASLAASILTLAAGLAAFYRQPVPWRSIVLLLAGALMVRAAIWDGQRNWLPYELAYQAPFAVLSAFCARMALKVGGRKTMERVLAAVFALISLQFLVKPFVAVAVGSGRTARDYTASTYALISQTMGGLLVVVAGLVILLIVFRRIVAESQMASETDALSGLANRRGFDGRALRLLAAARRLGRPVSVILFDLDHFKALNDTHGHASGDEVIRSFARILGDGAPVGSLLGRIGGEEFAVLLAGEGADGAYELAEKVRAAAAGVQAGPHPPFTVSAGVALVQPSEDLPQALRRADSALYRAKREGRDRVCLAEADSTQFPDLPQN